MNGSLLHVAIVFYLCALPAFAQQPVRAIPDRGPVTRDWPMFGGGPSRNMANLVDKKLNLMNWSIEEGKRANIRWEAQLGDRTYGSPVVANGIVYIGSNGKRLGGNLKDKSTLFAFREKDGKSLWQIHHDGPPPDHPLHKRIEGLFSTPTIDANRLYYVTPLNEVICADSATGNIEWRYDMVKELQVSQHDLSICPAFQFNGNLCSPLVVGEFVYVVTTNGTDENGKVTNPVAPSFVALKKKTGKLAWSSNLPGDRIIDGNWSNPAYTIVNREPQVIFAGGDGVIYGFVPETGKLIWKCDCLPFRNERPAKVQKLKLKQAFDDRVSVNPYFVGTPVVVEDRVFIGLGKYPEHLQGSGASYFLCLDISKRGDVSLKSYDKNDKTNKDSALVWAFGGKVEPPPSVGPRAKFHCTASTAAVSDGLAYIADDIGYVYCLDARTGELQWRYDVMANVMGSPYLVDGRILLGTDDGAMHIFNRSRAVRHIAEIDMDEQITTTPIVANGVLYVATRSKLYAINVR